MKGLLLAGGHGTRLRPLTFTGNKHLLTIANKPMILYGLEHLRNAGITDMAVVLGPTREGIVELLGDGSDFGVRVSYIEQPEPKGIAHAVQLAERRMKGEPFVTYLGDNLLKQGAGAFVERFGRSGADCVIGVCAVRDPSRYGVVEMERGRVARAVEKPKNPKSNLALVGVYVFGPAVFEAVRKIAPSPRGELEITDAIQWLIDSGARVEAQEVTGWWKDTGTVEDLVEANRLVLDDLKHQVSGSVEDESNVHGRVSVGPDSVIKRGAEVRGPVIIGKGSVVGEGVYVGPYTSIGDRVVLKSGEVENSMIMDGCTIDTSERIVDSLIGPNSTVSSLGAARPKGKRLVVGAQSTVEL
ncbi:MAG: glucose-1-phosphate thymidylyltransferase [Nitrososphaerota archaeon]|nr:glucose-1-phosphate thymidylyltransferase [Nitrososphaerota archaeon]MDG6919938.1 glucose-1-phosphate thymidylyltransferase [Nitrososphaerota archaeon]